MALRNRKGISDLVATLFLIAITVTAGILFYAYAAGLMGPLQPPPPKAPENLTIEMIAFSPDGSAQLTVRNLANANSKVASIYVDGTLIYSSASGALIPIGQATTFTLPNVTPTQHTFKVATLDGYIISTYGPENIYMVGTATGTVTATATSTSTGSSTTATATGTYTTTYTTIYTSTFTNTGSTTTTATTTNTWTSTNPTTYTTSFRTTQTITTTSTTTSTSVSHIGGPNWTTFTTTISSTITSTNQGSTSQTVTTSVTSTGTTTQKTTITSTGTLTGTTTVTSTVTTTTSALSPLLLGFFVFLSWSAYRSRPKEKSQTHSI